MYIYFHYPSSQYASTKQFTNNSLQIGSLSNHPHLPGPKARLNLQSIDNVFAMCIFLRKWDHCIVIPSSPQAHPASSSCAAVEKQEISGGNISRGAVSASTNWCLSRLGRVVARSINSAMIEAGGSLIFTGGTCCCAKDDAIRIVMQT